MGSVGIQELLAAGARAVVDTQLELDERGRDSLDAFGETGIPPTCFMWSALRLRCPVSVAVTPKEGMGEATGVALVPGGSASLTVGFRYLLSPQGVDDPIPQLPGPAGL